MKLSYFEGPEFRNPRGALKGWRHFLVLTPDGQSRSVIASPFHVQGECWLRGWTLFRAGTWESGDYGRNGAGEVTAFPAPRPEIMARLRGEPQQEEMAV